MPGYAVIGVLCLVILIIVIVYRSLASNYGAPKIKEYQKFQPKDTPATIDELKDEPIIIPKQFIADVKQIAPNCAEGHLIILWATGDFQTFARIYNTKNDDIDWLKGRYKFFVKKTKNIKRLEKGDSLFSL